MKLPRWNNARLQRPQGKRVVLRALHSGQGLEVKKRFSLPVEGEVFSLTFPFIDHAFALVTVWLRVKWRCFNSYRLGNPSTTVTVCVLPFAVDLLEHDCRSIPAQRAAPEVVADNAEMVFLVECDLRH